MKKLLVGCALALVVSPSSTLAQQLNCPTNNSASCSQSGAAMTVTNTNGGSTAYAGAFNTSGSSLTPAAVIGTATCSGDLCSGTGVRGVATPGGYGVHGSGEYGVWGEGATGVLGTGTEGVRGVGSSQGNGVTGTNTNGSVSWVYGQNNTASGYGVAGRNTATTGSGAAVYGDANNTSTGSYAGYFNGRTHSVGNLSTGGSKPFLIDHPLDPENKTLSHAALEAPEVLNVYSGTVRTDKKGRATIRLPEYFSALNRGEFRYQLTCVGEFAPVFVEKEIEGNEFTIAGASPGLKVSWQLTAVRNDRRMQRSPFVVEELKAASLRGKYLDPGAYDLPAEKSILPPPRKIEVGQRGMAGGVGGFGGRK